MSLPHLFLILKENCTSEQIQFVHNENSHGYLPKLKLEL